MEMEMEMEMEMTPASYCREEEEEETLSLTSQDWEEDEDEEIMEEDEEYTMASGEEEMEEEMEDETTALMSGEDDQEIVEDDEEEAIILASGEEEEVAENTLPFGYGDEVEVDDASDNNNGGDEPRRRRPRSDDDDDDSDLRTGKDHKLSTAVNQCIWAEEMLMRRYYDVLPPQDLYLSQKIKYHASALIQSDAAVVAALQVITSEAILMFKMLYLGVERNETTLFSSSRRIRLSALNIMLYRGSYQSSVSAVVLSMMHDVLKYRILESTVIILNSCESNTTIPHRVLEHRQRAANGFHSLVQELGCGGTGKAGTFTGLRRYGTVGGDLMRAVTVKSFLFGICGLLLYCFLVVAVMSL